MFQFAELGGGGNLIDKKKFGKNTSMLYNPRN